MTRPTKNRLGVYVIRRAVPHVLRPVMGRREWKETLGTKDPGEAKRRAPPVIVKMEADFAAARLALQPSRRLTLQEVMAHCGAWYRDFMAEHEEDPGPPDDIEAWMDTIRDGLEEDAEGTPVYRPSARDLHCAKAHLNARGVPADADSIRRFAIALHETRFRALDMLRDRAGGDYSPDPNLLTFPALQDRDAKAREPALTGEALLDAWASEKKPAFTTHAKYAGRLKLLASFLGFDDLRRVTPDDVVRFKEKRLADGRNPGTVEDDIIALGTLCRWAAKNRKMASNPFDGLAPKALRRGPKSRHPYNDDEAAHILIATRGNTGWLRWGSWLLAFSGARVGEVADLRRQDVRKDGGVWVIDFVPTEERHGKNETMQRLLPIHPAVIEEGFLDYALPLPSGPLFPDITANPRGGRSTNGGSMMQRWVRDKVGIKDPKKAPSHSWRHRMEDELRKVEAPAEAADAITGRHNPRNAGAGYGVGFRGMPRELAKVISRIPSPIQQPQEQRERQGQSSGR